MNIREEVVTRELAEEADVLRQLHSGARPLVLPNGWDVASARLVQGTGFPVVATSSELSRRALAMKTTTRSRRMTR